MANRIKIRHGSGTPNKDQLLPYELGWDYTNKILYINNNNSITNIINSVSNTWAAGTTAGPTIKTTVNGVSGTAVAIPAASKTASGVVTTGAQSFLGRKTFGYVSRDAYNDSGTAVRWACDTQIHNAAGNMVAEYWYDTGDATNVTTGQWAFRAYSPNSTASTSTTGKYETFYLPNVTTGRTGNASYNIITSKNPEDLGYYLPLAGGTLTGNLTFSGSAGIYYQGTKANYRMIRFIDNTSDTYGNGISIGGGGQTIIGGGESADAMAAQAGTAGGEIMWIGNDSDISFFSNLQNGWTSRKTFTMNSSGQFIPAVNCLSTSTVSSWLSGQDRTNAAYNVSNATDSGGYWPWMRQTNTSSAKWFSFGTLGTSFYWIGSATSRTTNGYDHGMNFDIATGKLLIDGVAAIRDSGTTARRIFLTTSASVPSGAVAGDIVLVKV